MALTRVVQLEVKDGGSPQTVLTFREGGISGSARALAVATPAQMRETARDLQAWASEIVGYVSIALESGYQVCRVLAG